MRNDIQIKTIKTGLYNWLTTVYVNGEIFKTVRTENRYQAKVMESKLNQVIELLTKGV